MKPNLLEIYERRVATGELQVDAAQQAAARRFARLADELTKWRNASSGFLGFFRATPEPPQGVYLHGAVGRGKTMLMDLFYDAALIKPKRRVHFHEFMAEVHDRIGEARKHVKGDPIPHVAMTISSEAHLLCFDEFHVTDIADAMILGRLFKVLFDENVVVVATSNTQPLNLYENGLNRQLFIPFIELLLRHMEVVELDASKDFRLDKLTGRRLYFTPADAQAGTELDTLWHDITGSASFESTTLHVKGRTVQVPRAANGSARFNFADLCEQPLGARDYLSIAREFHTVFIDEIPTLTPARRNEARRFINLVDTLYDTRTCLIASAAAEPDAIYPEGDGADLFERTVSRLIEMRSEGYLAECTDRNAALEAKDRDTTIAL